MRRYLPKFFRNQQGVAMIEFAMVLPFMLLLIFGAVELTRYIIIIQKVEKAAYMLTDAIGQFQPATLDEKATEITRARLLNIANQGYVSAMSPYNHAPSMSAVFSSVVRQGSQTRLRWRIAMVNVPGTSSITGSLTEQLRVQGGTCAVVNFTEAETSALMAQALNGENTIIGEVFYMYRPLLNTLISGLGGGGALLNNQLLVRRVFLHPRNGDLVDLPNPPAQKLIAVAGACT